MISKHHKNCQLSIVNYQLKPAFTLMEVVMSIAIFAIGMVAVAAIFPVAIHMQRATVEDMNAHQFKENILALVKTRGFDEHKISSQYDIGNYITDPININDTKLVLSGPDTMDDGGDPYWSLENRSYGAGGKLLLHNRHLFWIPLFYKADETGSTPWNMFIFIVTNSNGAIYYNPDGINDEYIANPITDNHISSDDITSPPAVPIVAKFVLSPVVDPASDGGEIMLEGPNDFNKKGGVYRIKIGDKVIGYSSAGGTDPNTYKVIRTGDSYITIKAPKSVDTIWAVLPGETSYGSYASSSYVDVIGPLINDPDSNNLVH